MATEQPSPIASNEKAHALITEERTKAALANDKGPDATFKSFEVIDFTSKGDNYACFVTSVNVTYAFNGEDDESVTYIVKLNPCRKSVAFEPFVTKIFMKESRFYLEFVPDLNDLLKKLNQPPLKMPRYLYSSLEPQKEIIYLEDMRAKHYKMFDRKKGMDERHTTLVIDEIAKLHAASALLQDSLGNEDITEKYPIFSEVFQGDDEQSQQMFAQVFQGHIQTGAQIANKMENYEKVATALNEMAPTVTEIFASQMETDPRFRVVCHGDCWNNNLLFRYDSDGNPVDVCLLDLQLNRVGSVALDLNYMLFTSLNGDTRKEHLNSFLSSYYSAFENIFSEAKKEMMFTEEELYKEYRNKNLFGLLLALMVVPMVVMDAADVPDFSEMTDDNLEEHMADHHATVISMIDTSAALRPRLLDLFDEMIEQGVIKV